MNQGSEKHVDSLDGLRGIAILLVFLFHYLPRNPHNPLSWIASFGWTGVDLFLVLSGFLITGILFDTRRSGNFLRVFYARRALRIFPLYFLAVGVVLLVAAILHSRMSWKAIPFFLYGANIMLAFKDGVPDTTPYFQCVHFWSLCLEEQFYSLWPLAFLFIRRRVMLMRICIGGIVMALLFRMVLTHFRVSSWIPYTELPARMDALLAGSLLALSLRESNSDFWRSRNNLYVFMGACGFMLLFLLFHARTLYLSSREMTSCGYSMLAGIYVSVLALALLPGTWANRIGRIPVLRFFGRYSYGLYVWHYLLSPICVTWEPWFAQHIHPLGLGQTIFALAMLSLFTLVAVLSYYAFEYRFLELKSRFQFTTFEGEYTEWPFRRLQVADDARLT
jgi:peptidoglycan/LPS O-acetylase OafA/YrhL